MAAFQVTTEVVRSIALGFRRRYTRQVITDHGIFNVRGLGLINTYTLPLEHVFVDLRVHPGNPQKFNLDLLASHVLEGNRPIWDFLRLDQLSDADAAALAIIGPPGSGKTTLLQHIAIVFAGNRHRRHNLRGKIPILLYFRELTGLLDEQRPDSLGAFTQSYFSDRHVFPSLKPPQNWFERQLRKGNCLILLDGLDEIANSELRKKLSLWVDNQIRSYPLCRFIVTARPRGYTDAPLQRANILEVQPFNETQTRQFVRNWYLANEVVSAGGKCDHTIKLRASRSAEDLLRRLRSLPALSALTVNPLLLTMISMVHRYRGELPGTRVELYAEICEVLLGRWRQVRGVHDDLKASQKLVVLTALAARLMLQKITNISTEEAMRLISSPLERIGLRSDEAKAFLVQIQAESGLLLEREADIWSFAHLTFQEFLTASYWREQKTLGLNLAESIEDAWWHETLCLYAAQGDGSEIVQACLDSNSVTALMLAVDCMEEARELTADLRKRVDHRLFTALESSDHTARRVASEVHLRRRLRSFHAIDETRAIDPSFITCAEYQLFLDECFPVNNFFQPDHWAFTVFPEGAAREPVSGVRLADSQRFCQWLTAKVGGYATFRLPTPDELSTVTVPAEILGAWTISTDGPALMGLSPTWCEKLRKELNSETQSIIPLPKDFISLLSKIDEVVISSALSFARTHTSSRSLDRAIITDHLDGSDFVSTGATRDLHRLELLAEGLHNSVTTSDHAHVLARTLTLARDQALKSVCQTLGKSLFTLSRGHHSQIAEICGAINVHHFAEARRSIGLLIDRAPEYKKEGFEMMELLFSLENSLKESRLALKRYAARMIESAYPDFEELSNPTAKSFYRSFLDFLKGKFEGHVDLVYKGIKQSDVVDTFWWLQVVTLRESGKISAWEGIRIVREDRDETAQSTTTQTIPPTVPGTARHVKVERA